MLRRKAPDRLSRHLLDGNAIAGHIVALSTYLGL
jgi:hypothetical protein